MTTPTHHSATLRFESGAIATLLMSFDIHASTLPHLEIYGTEGTLLLPDPNLYDGDVRLRRTGAEEWETLTPVIPPVALPGRGQLDRGVGVAHLAAAIGGAPSALDSSRADHLVEVLTAIEGSARSGRNVTIDSAVTRPWAGR